MLTFWGLFEESDIDAYVGTLLLPPFMSHLRRSPFRFSEQKHPDENEGALIVTYLGEGRIEEYPIHPEKHAIGLLRTICPSMNPESIRISPEEPVWNWSTAYARKTALADENEEEAGMSMRLYFEPVFTALKVDFPPRFDPRHCHVSVSLREMLIGVDVLKSYFSTWLHCLEGKTPARPVLPDIDWIAGGLHFQGERLGGEFILQDDDVFHDLLDFSGLTRSLKEVAGIVKLDLENAETEIDEDGFRFQLVPVS